jgi:trk system potassium uptake protein TrkH
MGYAVITLSGALLLSLPISSVEGSRQPFLDALFVATSGISTTGLSVVDVGNYYSVFGQIVLLVIFQIGGIGYMGLVVLMLYLLGVKGSFRTSSVAKESLAGTSLESFKKFFLIVLAYTFAFESVGAISLALVWMREYTLRHSIGLGIFHSVSAFCTAGFSTFPENLMRYRQSTAVNITIICVSLAGGIGFFVLRDLTAHAVKVMRRLRPRRLTLHTKLVLITTSAVLVISTAMVFLLEDWPATSSIYQRLMDSAFQTVSASTTDGYNTIDIGKMSPTSLTALMSLEFIGASPGSTGGGIKTTTLAVLLIFLYSTLRRRKTNVFGREITDKCVHDALVIFLCFVLVSFLDILILTATEKASYAQILFEIFSALGNTGLSTGITSSLSNAARAVLTVTMFIGRVGPLSIGYALLSRAGNGSFRYPREDVYVG